MGKAYYGDGGKTGYFRRLSRNKPSPTVTTRVDRKMSTIVHPIENRYVNVMELQRIQSFPIDYEFCGKSISSKYKQIGNAIPVKLAYEIALQIKGYLENNLNP